MGGKEDHMENEGRNERTGIVADMKGGFNTSLWKAWPVMSGRVDLLPAATVIYHNGKLEH